MSLQKGASIQRALQGPPTCAAHLRGHAERVWSDFVPLARHGPLTQANVSNLSALIKEYHGWQYYFTDVAILSGKLYFRKASIGAWLFAAIQLLQHTVNAHSGWIPDVVFVLSVLDDVHLERHRVSPLPLLSGVTTRGHWDIPVPSYTWFESSGGISSSGVAQDFSLWESEHWQKRLASKHPWASRSDRAFWRGHDWSSSNSWVELLPSLPDESCILKDDVTQSFSYRRWYAQLSQPGGELEGLLDVGLTGAPDFVKERYPNQTYVPPVDLPDHGKHKFLLHLDGTSWSNRFLKLLLMGSVVLKQDSVYEEYFYRDLKPWVHYVPFTRDRCSAANLTATIGWLREHDAEARAIAEAGQRFAREQLSRAGASCYWQRILASYASLQAFDPRLAVNLSEFTEWQSDSG